MSHNYEEISTPWEELTQLLTMRAYLKKFHPTVKISDDALALLVHAKSVEKSSTQFGDSFGHEICMGIRAGLFGAHAADNSSILHIKEENE